MEFRLRTCNTLFEETCSEVKVFAFLWLQLIRKLPLLQNINLTGKLKIPLRGLPSFVYSRNVIRDMKKVNK